MNSKSEDLIENMQREIDAMRGRLNDQDQRLAAVEDKLKRLGDDRLRKDQSSDCEVELALNQDQEARRNGAHRSPLRDLVPRS